MYNACDQQADPAPGEGDSRRLQGYLVLVKLFLVGGGRRVNLQGKHVCHIPLVGDCPALPALGAVLHLKAAIHHSTGPMSPHEQAHFGNALSTNYVSTYSM